jgi:signal transduction histidine kinase
VQLKTGELRGAYEALQSSDRVKTEFLMKMSHELRTPLNCIIGYSEAMIEGLDGPVSREQALSLDRIAQSGRRLLRMIENLLDLSRLDAGQMQLFCTETPLEEAIEDVLHQARSLVGGRPIRLEARVDGPLPLVWADPDRVRQVLFNLVGNALKFTEEGRVGIEARRLDEGAVEVRVSDTGPGVDPEYLHSIFDKFVQVPSGNRSGAGLGLSICREIVEKMGGEIRADSVLGEGSTFVVTVPVAEGRGPMSLPLGAGDGG